MFNSLFFELFLIIMGFKVIVIVLVVVVVVLVVVVVGFFQKLMAFLNYVYY